MAGTARPVKEEEGPVAAIYSSAGLSTERAYDGARGGTKGSDVEQLTVRSMHAEHDDGPW
jgi:hypothetical protein